MAERISVSDAARRLSPRIGREIAPREITLLFYNRVLPDSLAPIRRGRRRIEADALSAIADVLLENAQHVPPEVQL
jgi:hypothetical protein